MGPWAWDTGDSEDSDDDADGGGLVLNGEERAIAIETEDGVWQLFWELGNGEEGGRGIPEMKGKRKLRVSLDRVFVEGKEEAGKGVKKEGAAEDKEKKVGRVEGGVEVRSQQGGKREGRATEATLEVRTKTREGKEVKGEESGKGKREEKKKYEFKG